LDDAVDRKRRDLRPGGRLIIARRVQRREQWEIISRPVGTLEVLTHTPEASGAGRDRPSPWFCGQWHHGRSLAPDL